MTGEVLNGHNHDLMRKENLASVGVGIGGVLASPKKVEALAESLALSGAVFRTRTKAPKKNGVTLPDGSVVHGAEASLISLGRLYRSGDPIAEGIRKLNIRSESVGLYLSSKQLDRLYAVNHNSRLLVASTPSATVVSSSRMGIPDDSMWIMEIPPNTIATITRQTVECEVLWTDEDLFDFSIPEGLEDRVLEFLKNQSGTTWFEVIEKAITPQFPNDKATLAFPIGYQVIETLLSACVLRFEVEEVTGVEGQFPIPKMLLFLK